MVAVYYLSSMTMSRVMSDVGVFGLSVVTQNSTQAKKWKMALCITAAREGVPHKT
jgi:hypothetical protein